MDWRADCSAIEVSEDGASFAKLVDAMYARGMKEQALSANCIDKLSGTQCMWHYSSTSTLSACAAQACTDMLRLDWLSELQRKFKMKDLHESCSLFITDISLTVDNLSRHILASNFGFENAIEHCRKFVENGMFDAIRR